MSCDTSAVSLYKWTFDSCLNIRTLSVCLKLVSYAEKNMGWMAATHFYPLFGSQKVKVTRILFFVCGWCICQYSVCCWMFIKWIKSNIVNVSAWEQCVLTNSNTKEIETVDILMKNIRSIPVVLTPNRLSEWQNTGSDWSSCKK